LFQLATCSQRFCSTPARLVTAMRIASTTGGFLVHLMNARVRNHGTDRIEQLAGTIGLLDIDEGACQLQAQSRIVTRFFLPQCDGSLASFGIFGIDNRYVRPRISGRIDAELIAAALSMGPKASLGFGGSSGFCAGCADPGTEVEIIQSHLLSTAPATQSLV